MPPARTPWFVLVVALARFPAPCAASGPRGGISDSDANYAELATRDVKTVMIDTGPAYTQARARLVAHPQRAAEALLDSLKHVPAPGPAARKRVMDVLAEFKRPEDAERFAAELRAAVTQADTATDAIKAADRWRPVVVAQRANATSALRRLVGDRSIPIPVRSLLVQDLVAVGTPDQLGAMVVLLSRGHRALRDQLRRSLRQRARVDPKARSALEEACDAAWTRLRIATAADPVAQLAALVALRSAITPSPAVELVRRMAGLARDPRAPFGARVAAVRALGTRTEALAIATLHAIASIHLHVDRRQMQASEVLGALAFERLPLASATALAHALDLRNAPQPRLATLGWKLSVLPAGSAWLAEANKNPWPQVRRIAYARVQPPCQRSTAKQLDAAARSEFHGGATARAAVVALGRCQSNAAQAKLRHLLRDTSAVTEQRAEAALQLVRRGGSRGANAVARLLRRRIDRRLARRLARGLGETPEPTPQVIKALCARAMAEDEIALEARAGLRTLGFDYHRC